VSSRNRNKRMKFDYLEFLAKKIVKPLHGFTVSGRRVKILSHHLSQLVPHNQSLTGLDVGCGSGEIAKNIQNICPYIEMNGVDVLVRKGAAISITEFNGERLPFEDKSYDFTMLIDVLHHTDDPAILMKECVRVSRKFVLIKDHICESWWDRTRLRFMDWVGNRAYNVALPYNYLSQRDWKKLYQVSKIVCEIKVSKLNLYSKPLSFLFDQSLHFVARVAIAEDPKT